MQSGHPCGNLAQTNRMKEGLVHPWPVGRTKSSWHQRSTLRTEVRWLSARKVVPHACSVLVKNPFPEQAHTFGAPRAMTTGQHNEKTTSLSRKAPEALTEDCFPWRNIEAHTDINFNSSKKQMHACTKAKRIALKPSVSGSEFCGLDRPPVKEKGN